MQKNMEVDYYDKNFIEDFRGLFYGRVDLKKWIEEIRKNFVDLLNIERERMKQINNKDV